MAIQHLSAALIGAVIGASGNPQADWSDSTFQNIWAKEGAGKRFMGRQEVGGKVVLGKKRLTESGRNRVAEPVGKVSAIGKEEG